MDQIQLTPQQFFIYAMLIGAAVGFVLGLLPLIVGIVKKRGRLGVFGLLAATIAGALHPLLAIPVAAIFVWLTLKKPAQTTGATRDPLDSALDKDVS